VEIAEGIYWVGFHDPLAGLHCNPYLIVDNEEAIVIDGGSRPDFASVMMKILKTGIAPGQIKALLYQHYDPDLCGSIPNFEDMIDRRDLKVISDRSSLAFIRHYAVSSPMLTTEGMDLCYTFSSGRTLEFIKTPHSHSSGSFVTFDPQSGVLFTSDIFGSYGTDWELFLDLPPHCIDCVSLDSCPKKNDHCPINDILNFHRAIMTSGKALRHALKKILETPFTIIAPQHGSVIVDSSHMKYIFGLLLSQQGIGIDGIIEDEDDTDFPNLQERFGVDGH
jgi:flavorubredoxin